jgi:hypothetical protein
MPLASVESNATPPSTCRVTPLNASKISGWNASSISLYEVDVVLIDVKPHGQLGQE